jgi:hypothetical protein
MVVRVLFCLRKTAIALIREMQEKTPFILQQKLNQSLWDHLLQSKMTLDW